MLFQQQPQFCRNMRSFQSTFQFLYYCCQLSCKPGELFQDIKIIPLSIPCLLTRECRQSTQFSYLHFLSTSYITCPFRPFLLYFSTYPSLTFSYAALKHSYQYGNSFSTVPHQVDFESMEIIEPDRRPIRRTFHPGVWVQFNQSTHEIQLHSKINDIQVRM